MIRIPTLTFSHVLSSVDQTNLKNNVLDSKSFFCLSSFSRIDYRFLVTLSLSIHHPFLNPKNCVFLSLTEFVFQIFQIGLNCLNRLCSLRCILSEQVALRTTPNINGSFTFNNCRDCDTRRITIRLVLFDFATRKDGLYSVCCSAIFLVATISVAALNEEKVKKNKRTNISCLRLKHLESK